MGPEETSRRSLVRQRLESAIASLGLPPIDAIEDLAALIEDVRRPSQMDVESRHLFLEWLGAQDAVVRSSGRLSHRDLMSVFARRSAVESLNALTVERAAKALGVSTSACQRLLDTGQLWSYNLGNGPRVPTWQMTRRVPGGPAILISEMLNIVVAAIPPGESPALIRHLLTLENAALQDANGRALSPRRWLLAGMQPWPVASIVLGATGGDEEAVACFLDGRHARRDPTD